ncbi:MAG: response regulator transcription factor [Erysipelotrichaceae bacterium]|nr:response regulator transcription factor [Erysipelotrichaceae bacterium]
MAINCVIIDDNKKELNTIESALSTLTYGTEYSLLIDSFFSFTQLDLEEKYNLYILDIDMPDISGFQMARKIYDRYPDATIVFCTNHDDLVFDSFKLDAFYFVRKSFLKDDLSAALQKFVRNYVNDNSFYLLKTRFEIIKLPYQDIAYFEVAGNDLFVHLLDGTEYSERKSISSILDLLPKNAFVRVDKNFLINLKHISGISDNKLYLTTGKEFIIPKAKIGYVKSEYVNYLMR